MPGSDDAPAVTVVRYYRSPKGKNPWKFVLSDGRTVSAGEVAVMAGVQKGAICLRARSKWPPHRMALPAQHLKSALKAPRLDIPWEEDGFAQSLVAETVKAFGRGERDAAGGQMSAPGLPGRP